MLARAACRRRSSNQHLTLQNASGVGNFHRDLTYGLLHSHIHVFLRGPSVWPFTHRTLLELIELLDDFCHVTVGGLGHQLRDLNFHTAVTKVLAATQTWH
jgi:hypothetical protein